MMHRVIVLRPSKERKKKHIARQDITAEKISRELLKMTTDPAQGAIR